MKRRLVIFLAMVMFGAAPVAARADVLLTPFAGVTFGGHASIHQPVVGVSLAFMGGGIIGVDVDFGYSSNFFKDNERFDQFDFTSDKVMSLMTNLIVGIPIGGSNASVRPYASGGLGLLRTSATGLFTDISNNDFGVNVGAGVMGFFNDHVGLRGDVRYFRSLQKNSDTAFDVELGNFNFTRGTVGLVFKF